MRKNDSFFSPWTTCKMPAVTTALYPAVKTLISHFFMSNVRALCLCLSLATTIAFAQPIIDSPVLSQLSPNQGLSQATVNSMIIDHDGFLWVATEAGLSRFDGYDVKHIQEASGKFDNESITYLFQGSGKKIWIGTLSSGIYSLNPETGEIKAELSLELRNNPEWAQAVSDMIQLESGELIIALDEQVIQLNEDGSNMRVIFSISDAQLENLDIVRSILIKDDWLYIGMTDGLHVQYMPNGIHKNIPLLKQDSSTRDQRNTKELHLDKDNRLWIGTVGGLYSVPTAQIEGFFKGELDELQTREDLTFRNIWQILDTEDGYYLATDDGLFLLDPEDRSVKHILRLGDARFQVSDEDIKSLVVDSKNNFWMATTSDGAFYWSPKSIGFKNFYARQGGKVALSNDTVYSFYEDRLHTVLL